MDGMQKYLQIPYPFAKYLIAPDIAFNNDIELRTESHPLLQMDCNEGSVDLQFSCLNSFGNPIIYLTEQSNDIDWIEVDQIFYTCCEIIHFQTPANSKRCRFIVHLAFPNVGTYKLNLLFDNKIYWTSYINNKTPCTNIPFLHYQVADSKFLPIVPKTLFEKVSEGYGIVRFAIAKESSNITIAAEQFPEDNWKDGQLVPDISKHIKLIIPNDESRYEVVTAITFPQNGRYKVTFSKKHQHESNRFEAIYFFEVTGSKIQDFISIFDYIFQGRKFAPVDWGDISIKPQESFIVVDYSYFEISVKVIKGYKLELLFVYSAKARSVDFGYIEQVEKKSDREFDMYRFLLHFDEIGFYHLRKKNNDYDHEITFYFGGVRNLERPTQEEILIRKEVKEIVEKPVDEIKEVKEFYSEETVKKLSIEVDEIDNIYPEVEEDNTQTKNPLTIPELNLIEDYSKEQLDLIDLLDIKFSASNFKPLLSYRPRSKQTNNKGKRVPLTQRIGKGVKRKPLESTSKRFILRPKPLQEDLAFLSQKVPDSEVKKKKKKVKAIKPGEVTKSRLIDFGSTSNLEIPSTPPKKTKKSKKGKKKSKEKKSSKVSTIVNPTTDASLPSGGKISNLTPPSLGANLKFPKSSKPKKNVVTPPPQITIPRFGPQPKVSISHMPGTLNPISSTGGKVGAIPFSKLPPLNPTNPQLNLEQSQIPANTSQLPSLHPSKPITNSGNQPPVHPSRSQLPPLRPSASQSNDLSNEETDPTKLTQKSKKGKKGKKKANKSP